MSTNSTCWRFIQETDLFNAAVETMFGFSFAPNSLPPPLLFPFASALLPSSAICATSSGEPKSVSLKCNYDADHEARPPLSHTVTLPDKRVSFRPDDPAGERVFTSGQCDGTEFW